MYVPSIGRYLVEQGHEVRVVAFCSQDHHTDYPFEVVPIPFASLPVRYLKAFFAVLREAKDADVVYVQEHLALLHVLAAKLRGVPAVIRIMVDGSWEIAHRKGWIDGDDINVYQGKRYGLRVALTRRLQRLWWGWCSKLISCSDFLRRIPIESYGVPEDKVQLIYNAYHGPSADDVPETPAEAREALGLAPDKRYVLTVCRLMVWKGVDGILRALQGLPDDVELLVAGDGDMLEPWKALAVELGLEDRAHFLGNVPHERIPLYIRASEIFVLNSEYEGLSHTLLEVAALGTPIVCTGVCGNPEVVADGENGFLVPPKDPVRLREAISRLLDDPDLARRFVAESRARMSRFTREGTFPEVERLLASVARR